MIIYGSKPVHLKTVQPSSAVCPHCGQTGTTMISAYSKHAHIFWIPLFPFGKVGVSQCKHCKQALSEGNLTPELKREYNILKAETKAPLWQFSGLGLIAALVMLMSYTTGEDHKKQLEYVANPVAGDIYKFKTENSRYSTLKVIRVSADSIFVTPNEYEIDKMSAVYKIDKAENYGDYSYGISKEEMKQMHTKKDIYDIDRN